MIEKENQVLARQLFRSPTKGVVSLQPSKNTNRVISRVLQDSKVANFNLVILLKFLLLFMRIDSRKLTTG